MTMEEKMLRIIRNQVNKEKGKGLQYAKMKTSELCAVGDLILYPEDYKKAAGLSLETGDEVLISRVDEELYVIIAKVV